MLQFKSVFRIFADGGVFSLRLGGISGKYKNAKSYIDNAA